MNYRKEQRNVEILQRKKRKKPRGFIWPQDIGRSGRYLEEKKLASSLNNGKIRDFYSLQSNYMASKRAHHNKFYFLQLRQTSEHEDTNHILHEV